MGSKILLVIAFALIALMPLVASLGITPGRTTIEFTPNLEKDVSFSVLNTEHKNMNIAFTIRGELKDSIALDNNVEKFIGSENSKDFTYKIKVSQLEPGLHTAEIVVTELPEDIESKEMLIKATVAVVTQVYVYVPYPGKYLDSELSIVNPEGSNSVNLYVSFIGRGKETVENAKAVINIYKENEKIATLNTDEKSVSYGERTELGAVWNSESAHGEYNALVDIVYDGQTRRIEKKFNIGNESLKVLDISTNNFQLGQIAKLRVLVQNKMSDSVKQASAGLNIFNSNMENIASIKSENYDIPALSNKEMIMYWDTESLSQGEYSSDLNINYDQKFINKQFKVQVNTDSISFSGVGFAVSSESSGKISIKTILYIIISIFILVNLAWLVYWLRRRSRNNKKRSEKKNEKGGVVKIK